MCTGAPLQKQPFSIHETNPATSELTATSGLVEQGHLEMTAVEKILVAHLSPSWSRKRDEPNGKSC